jgi:hypothetical protein
MISSASARGSVSCDIAFSSVRPAGDSAGATAVSLGGGRRVRRGLRRRLAGPSAGLCVNPRTHRRSSNSGTRRCCRTLPPETPVSRNIGVAQKTAASSSVCPATPQFPDGSVRGGWNPTALRGRHSATAPGERPDHKSDRAGDGGLWRSGCRQPREPIGHATSWIRRFRGGAADPFAGEARVRRATHRAQEAGGPGRRAGRNAIMSPLSCSTSPWSPQRESGRMAPR